MFFDPDKSGHNCRLTRQVNLVDGIGGGRAMRLRHAVVAGALGLTVIAAGGVTMRPAGAAVTDPSAANPAITVRAIDRAGKQVAVQATLVNLASGASYSLSSAHPTRVPRGSYDIGAFVVEPKTFDQTLVDRQLTVTGPQTVTFDARKGRPVLLTVNDTAVAQSQVVAEVFSDVGNFGSYTAPGQTLYAVPGALPAGWGVFLLASLTEQHPAGTAEQYGLIHLLNGAIPASLTFASDRSKLATVHVTERRVDPGDSTLFEISPMAGPVNFPGVVPSSSPLYTYGPTPFSVTYHLTPGYGWAEWDALGSAVMNDLPIWGAHSYPQTFDSAVFSPSPNLELTTSVQGNVLGTGSTGQSLFVDPWHTMDSQGLATATVQAWLYQGSKQLAYSDSGYISATIPAAVRWYRLRLEATRPAGATLSKSLRVNYTFPAGAQPGQGTYYPDAVMPRLVPSGLNWLNAARHGTKTTVSVTFFAPGSVHSVAVWASANGGKTWYPLRVSGGGTRFSVTVTNPAKAGFVSLRVRGADASGVSTDETIVNAYAVS
jgi:hypothetical protein